ncbi:MAG: chemotaxis protein CheX [Thermodesulfobacteriota bacterium]|nr:chemotaxis protein CheX [Thermodesulfobacteriota bacterium]
MTNIAAFDLRTSVINSVKDVFDTMLSMDIEVSSAVTQASLDGIKLVGSVSFVGDAMGSVYVQVSDDFAHNITAAMLGIDVEEIEGEDEISDVVGELSNMIGGNLKSGFCDFGLTCALSTPSIITGKDFKVETINMARHERFAFNCKQHTVFVEVCIKSVK